MNEEDFKNQLRNKLKQHEEELNELVEKAEKNKGKDDEPRGALLEGTKVLENWSKDDDE